MQPVPFEITDGPSDLKIASNGSVQVILEEGDGRLFKRRAVSGLAMKSPTDTLVPQLNQFAGELLANQEMKPQEAVDRLMAIAGSVHIAEPQKHEWAVVHLGDVYVYCDGKHVIVTRRELTPG